MQNGSAKHAPGRHGHRVTTGRLFLGRTGAAVLLVLWSLLMASVDGAYAGITQARSLPAPGQSAAHETADVEDAHEAVSSFPGFPAGLLLSREDSPKEQSEPISLQADVSVALTETGQPLSEKSLLSTSAIIGAHGGMPSHAGRRGISDETLTDGAKRDTCGRIISLRRSAEIKYDRSLFAEADTTMGISPDPLKERACEKSDDPLNEGLISGDVRIRDWPGIGRDTAYFFGYQFVVVGLLYVLPESVTGWTKDQKEEYDFDRWVKNVSNPQWDEDKWYLNYLVHPYWGAVYYIRARERGFDKLESFVYSAFLSALFEFGVEALFEPPSYQDLIVTPIAGTLVGMYVFEPIRQKIKAKGPQQEWYDKLALVLTDPLGVLSDFTDRVLGVKSSVRIAHSAPSKQRCKPIERDPQRPAMIMSSTSCGNPYTGIQMTFQW